MKVGDIAYTVHNGLAIKLGEVESIREGITRADSNATYYDSTSSNVKVAGKWYSFGDCRTEAEIIWCGYPIAQ